MVGPSIPISLIHPWISYTTHFINPQGLKKFSTYLLCQLITNAYSTSHNHILPRNKRELELQLAAVLNWSSRLICSLSMSLPWRSNLINRLQFRSNTLGILLQLDLVMNPIDSHVKWNLCETTQPQCVWIKLGWVHSIGNPSETKSRPKVNPRLIRPFKNSPIYEHGSRPVL